MCGTWGPMIGLLGTRTERRLRSSREATSAPWICPDEHRLGLRHGFGRAFFRGLYGTQLPVGPWGNCRFGLEHSFRYNKRLPCLRFLWKWKYGRQRSVCAGFRLQQCELPRDAFRNKSDSLARLLSTSNPETGTINYVYDPNSNVVSRTAPLPNQNPGSTATV